MLKSKKNEFLEFFHISSNYIQIIAFSKLKRCSNYPKNLHWWEILHKQTTETSNKTNKKTSMFVFQLQKPKKYLKTFRKMKWKSKLEVWNKKFDSLHGTKPCVNGCEKMLQISTKTLQRNLFKQKLEKADFLCSQKNKNRRFLQFFCARFKLKKNREFFALKFDCWYEGTVFFRWSWRYFFFS